MSEQIRDTIASKKKLLQRQLSKIPNFPSDPKPKSGQAAEEAVIELCALESQVEDHHRRLSSSVAAIEAAQADWTRVLTNRTEKEREKDVKAYQDFMASDDNPTATIDLATTTTDGLEDLLIKVRSELAQARLLIERASETARDKQRQHDLAMANAQAEAAKATQAAQADAAKVAQATQAVASLPLPPQSQPAQKDKLKLPVIEPTKFAGSREEFWQWWRLYKATVHDNTNESDLLKMTRLYALLEGPAMDLLAGLDITADNYPKATQLLLDYYGDEKARVKELIFQLESLPFCKDMKGVSEFSLRLEKICLQLESLKHPIDPMCWVRLQAKLTLFVIKELQKTERADPSNWNMGKFRAELKRLVKEDEEAYRVKGLAPKRVEEKQEKPGPTKERSPKKAEKSLTYATQAGKPSEQAKSDKPRPKSEPKCNFQCNAQGSHWPNQCKRFQTVEERKERAKELKLCYKCLRSTHMANKCDSRVRCFICKVDGHVSAMCYKQKDDKSTKSKKEDKSGSRPKKKPKESDSDESEVGGQTAAANLEASGDAKRTSVSMCIRADVFNPYKKNVKKSALIVFDTLCHISFIKDELRQALELPSEGRVNLPLLSFQAKKPKDHECDQVKLGIDLINGKKLQLDFYTTESIVTKSAAVLLSKQDLNKASLYGNWVAGTKEEPDILIGIDQEGVFDIRNIHGAETLSSGFVLKSSLLGPILSGRGQLKIVKKHPSVHAAPVIHQAIDADASSEQLLEDHFTLESLGIAADTEDPDRRTHELFRKTLRRVGDFPGDRKERFEVSLPFNENLKQLPSNHGLAKKRACRTWEVTMKDSKLLAEAPSIMKGMRDANFVEKVKSPKDVTGNPIHYLAYQFVWKEGPDGRMKGRLVLDGSARLSGQTSLNGCLERGPVLLNDLMGVILRYRLSRVAVLCDVAKAFLQVSLDKHDRDVTRFLWPRDVNDLSKGFDTWRFCRLPFGLKPSPFLLAATIDEYLASLPSALSNEIRRNLYVDNVLIRAENSQEARAKSEQVKELFAKARMPLREFVSNSNEAVDFLESGERLDRKIIKVLGTVWDTESDELIYHFPRVQEDDWTLRKMTKLVSKMYDPCGLWAPCMVPAKIALSEVWKWVGQQESDKDPISDKKRKWDTSLPDMLQANWREAIASWKAAVGRVDRRVTTLTGSKRYELHAYGDASEYAFGTCLYLVTRGEDKAESLLILSKGRVTPCGKTKWTIPRLELMATLLSARILKYAKKQLDIPIESCTIWADAQCVIDWIKSPVRGDRFVKGKKVEIRKNKEFYLRHVPGTDNPADLLSRGRTIDELSGDSEDARLWRHGPQYLLNDKSTWPGHECCIGDLPEEKDENETIFTTAVTLQPPLVDPSDTRLPSWRQKRRIVGYVLKFIQKKLLKKLSAARKLPPFLARLAKIETSSVLTPAERHFAGMHLIRQDQLRNPPSPDAIKELQIYTDDQGVMRCRLRLDESELSESAKRPIFLNEESTLTKLIIVDCHLTLHHIGVRTTLASLRRQYWIPKGRRTISTAIRSCPILGCLKYQKKNFETRPDPELPKERVVIERAFENTGVDYAGPFTVKVNEEEAKAYVLLFTCMSTRCIHLEVTQDYTTDSFLLAFRRFASRRGSPRRMFSDHGSQFESGAKIVKDVFRSKGFQAFLAERSIDWRFVTEKAPWAGGFYEAMIKLLKASMRRTIGKSVLRIERFATLVTEIEGFINGRPLTFVSDSLDPSSVRPLRPADFLFPAGDTVEPADVDEEGEVFQPMSRDKLVEKIERDHQKLKRFKEEFYQHYLPALRERKSKMVKKNVSREPVLGEVVLIEGDDPNRLTWQIGRITELVPSRDGHVRTVKVLVKDRLLRRPVTLLYPLEVDADTNEKDGLTRIEIKRKGKLLKIGSEAPPPPGRTHKMRLRNRPSDDTPILTCSGMLGDEELDYDETQWDDMETAPMAPTIVDSVAVAIDSTGETSVPTKHRASTEQRAHVVKAPLLRVVQNGPKLGSPAMRFIKHHLAGAAEDGKTALEKAEALKKRQGEIESRVMDKRQAWPKWSNKGRGGGVGTKGGRQYEPYNTHHRRNDAEAAGCSRSGRGTSDRRPRSPTVSRRPRSPTKRSGRGRSRSRSRSLSDHQPRHHERPRSSHRPTGHTGRERRSESCDDHHHHRRERECPQPVREPDAVDAQLYHELSMESDTGLEPMKACKHCKGLRPIDVDTGLFLFHPQVAYERLRTPVAQIYLQCAFHMEKSMKTVEFAKKLVRCESHFGLLWEERKNKILPRDTVKKAMEAYLFQCPKAKAYLDAVELKPFKWLSSEQENEADGEAARLWISLLNEIVGTNHGKKTITSPTMIIGDSWATQLGLSLKSVYLYPDPWKLIKEAVEKQLFLGNVKNCIIFAGRDDIRFDTVNSDFTEPLKECLQVLPKYVRVAYIEPPKVPSHEVAWRRHRKALKKVLRSTDGPKVEFVQLPQLNSEGVAPKFIEEAVEFDGELKELGSLAVVHQLNFKLGLKLQYKSRAPKARKIKGHYGSFQEPEEPRPSLDQRMKKGIATGTLFMTCLCLCLLTLPIGSATDPMSCDKQATSHLYDLSNYLSTCELQPEDDTTEWEKTLMVYANNTAEHDTTASLCYRKTESITYGYAWGVRSSHPSRTRYKRVSPEECREWIRAKKCEIHDKVERLEADGEIWHTNLKSEIAYGRWYNPFSWGNDVAETENCFVTETLLVASTLLDHVSTEVGDTRGCRYSSGVCSLPDKSVLVWEPVKSLLCPFKELGLWKGSYYYDRRKYVWTASNEQFTLSFQQDSDPVRSKSDECDEQRGVDFVISDSGLAVEAQSFFSLSRSRRKRETKPTAEVEFVRNDVLASQLTAATKHCEKNDRKVAKRLRNMICAVAKGVYTPSREEATLLARDILGTPYVQAEFPTARPIMEVWYCQRIGSMSNVSFHANNSDGGQCFKRPLVNITTHSGDKVKRHLDTRLMIATEDSDKGPCELYRSRVVDINGQLHRVNQETGTLAAVPEIIKLTHGLNNSWSLPDLSHLEFHNWVLFKQKSALQLEDARIKARLAQAKIRDKSMVHDQGEDYHSPQQRVQLPSLDEYLFSWIPNPPKLLTSIVIYAITIKIGWLIFCYCIWPWIAVKLMRKLLPTRYQHWAKNNIGADQTQTLLAELQEAVKQIKDGGQPTVMESTLVENSQLRAQLQRTEESMRLMKQQIERLQSSAKAAERPSTSTAVGETQSTDDKEDDGLGTIGRGTTERKTTRLLKHLREKAFLKPGVSGTDA